MNDPTDLSAFDISEMVLTITGEALMAGDAEGFADRFTVPHLVGTFEGDRVLETRQDVIATFQDVVGHMRSIGCNKLVRYTLAAEFDGPETVKATFESHALNGAIKLRDPVMSYGTLRLDQGTWKVAESRYAVSNTPELDDAIMGRAERNTDLKNTRPKPSGANRK